MFACKHVPEAARSPDPKETSLHVTPLEEVAGTSPSALLAAVSSTDGVSICGSGMSRTTAGTSTRVSENMRYLFVFMS